MVCNVCKQDIANFIEEKKVLKEGVPYRICRCRYCGSRYSIVDDSNENVLMLNVTDDYDKDLKIAKMVKLAKIHDCSISDITEFMVSEYHPKIISYDKYMTELDLNVSYVEDKNLFTRAVKNPDIIINAREV